MALRRVVGSSNYIPKFGRLAASNRLFGIGGHERYVFKPTKNRKPEGFDYHMYLGGLGPARFATQEFNKLKNAQLQISRVLRVKGMHFREEFRNSSEFYRRCYLMMLEAVGADGVKLYKTEIRVDSIDSSMALQDFCVIDDKKRPIILYHHLDNFFAE